jgi:hypothetical protein
MELNYKVIGSDNQEYGPITLQQLQVWIKEGRVTGATQVLRSDQQHWSTASSFMELQVPDAVGAVAAGCAIVGQVVPDADTQELQKQIKSGASWFYWIAGLSLINSVVALAGSDWGFVLGLAITKVIDIFAREVIGGGALAVAFVFDVIACGLFILFGVFAHKNHTWGFLTGIILYTLDGLLSLLFQDWLGLAFHGLALVFIFIGLKANLKLNKAVK